MISITIRKRTLLRIVIDIFGLYPYNIDVFRSIFAFSTFFGCIHLCENFGHHLSDLACCLSFDICLRSHL